MSPLRVLRPKISLTPNQEGAVNLRGALPAHRQALLAKPQLHPLSLLKRPPSDLPTTKADGVMVLLSPHIDARQVRWREHKVGRLLEVRFGFGASPFVLLAVYQHVWSSNKTTQQNRRDRATLLSALSKAVKQVPSRTQDLLSCDGRF